MDEITLVLCKKCDGHGRRFWDELVDYHKREYVEHSEECKCCEGSGRRWQTVTTTFKAYKPAMGDKHD